MLAAIREDFVLDHFCRVLSVGEMGPERLTLKDPVNLPVCVGEVALFVDGQERRWPVRLPDGASESSPFVRAERVNTNGYPSATFT